MSSETRNSERNNVLWRRLFVSSNNESFDIDTLWTSYASKVNNPPVEMNKNVRDIVNFAAPSVRTFMKSKCGQVLMSSTNKKIKTESARNNIEWVSNRCC